MAGYTRFLELAGGAFAETVVRGVFGLQPGLGDDPAGWLADAPQNRFVRARLLHVPLRGALYTIASGPAGLSIEKETP